jgi:hypothetical protein
MWKSFYEANALLDLPLMAMAIFMGAFTIATVRAWLRGNDLPMSRLPLDEDRHE